MSVFWFVCAIVLIVFVGIQKNQPPFGSEQVLLSNKAGAVGTITSFTDTNSNTWFFRMRTNSSVLEYVWRSPTGSPLVVWDSANGSCGPNQANYTSMTLDSSVSTRTQGVTLAQTPMYIDPQGVQRTFRLQLYNADVRVESTNGDNRFWSVFGGNIFTPLGWPSSISNGTLPLWSNATSNFVFYSQFLQNGELIVQIPNGTNIQFQASQFANPVC